MSYIKNIERISRKVTVKFKELNFMNHKFIRFSDMVDGKFIFRGETYSFMDAAHNRGYFTNCDFWLSFALRSCMLIKVLRDGIEVRMVSV